MFILSLAAGPRLIYLVNKASWKTNMKQVRSRQQLDVSTADLVSSVLQLQRYGCMPLSSSIWAHLS